MSNLFWSPRRQDIVEQVIDTVQKVDDPNFVPAPIPREMDRAETNERLDQLLLVCAAMWELLSEKTNLTENDLVTRIAEIDARDGVADGKITHAPQKCPQCQRIIFPKQQRCLYCGSPRPVETVFKSI